MWRTLVVLLCLGLSVFSLNSFAFNNVFYALRDDKATQVYDHFQVLKDIKQHHRKINIFIPQAFNINQDGFVFGEVNPKTAAVVKRYHLKLMPMVTNQAFDKQEVHQFLQDPKAQQRAIDTLLMLCQQHHYYGLQIDFEHIPAADRDAYTQFFTNISHALHKHDFKISVTIVPSTMLVPRSVRLMRLFENYVGVYDLAKLGKLSDFVVDMTYNQHGATSTAGPTTSYAWANRVLKYTLQYIPANKLYLGIPTVSLYWHMARLTYLSGKPDVNQGVSLSYHDARLIQKEFGFKWRWDNNAKVSYGVYSYNDLYHYVFMEDAKAIAELIKLAHKHKLGGVAVFRLGDEDPAMWRDFH